MISDLDKFKDVLLMQVIRTPIDERWIEWHCATFGVTRETAEQLLANWKLHIEHAERTACFGGQNFQADGDGGTEHGL